MKSLTVDLGPSQDPGNFRKVLGVFLTVVKRSLLAGGSAASRWVYLAVGSLVLSDPLGWDSGPSAHPGTRAQFTSQGQLFEGWALWQRHGELGGLSKSWAFWVHNS